MSPKTQLCCLSPLKWYSFHLLASSVSCEEKEDAEISLAEWLTILCMSGFERCTTCHYPHSYPSHPTPLCWSTKPRPHWQAEYSALRQWMSVCVHLSRMGGGQTAPGWRELKELLKDLSFPQTHTHRNTNTPSPCQTDWTQFRCQSDCQTASNRELEGAVELIKNRSLAESFDFTSDYQTLHGSPSFPVEETCLFVYVQILLV